MGIQWGTFNQYDLNRYRAKKWKRLKRPKFARTICGRF
jgi:hypothetical protein